MKTFIRGSTGVNSTNLLYKRILLNLDEFAPTSNRRPLGGSSRNKGFLYTVNHVGHDREKKLLSAFYRIYLSSEQRSGVSLF